MVEKQELCGHTLLGDHLMTGMDMGLFVDDEKFGLLLRDVGTDVGDLLATVAESKVDTVRAIREFGANVRWKFFSSDDVPELQAAADLEQMVYLWRTPYRPGSSDVTERFVGMVAGRARCLLARSSWLAARWPYAARAFCHEKAGSSAC